MQIQGLAVAGYASSFQKSGKMGKVREGPRLQGRSKTISTGDAAARLRHLALHLALRWDLRGVNLHFIT